MRAADYKLPAKGFNGRGFQWESEAPAELSPPRFGRSLTLPGNELVAQSRCEHVCRGGLSLPVESRLSLALND